MVLKKPLLKQCKQLLIIESNNFQHRFLLSLMQNQLSYLKLALHIDIVLLLKAMYIHKLLLLLVLWQK